MEQLQIRLVNVGPHSDLPLTFQPGVNILRARNGAGKSQAIAATAAAFGGKENVTVKDGHISGSVQVDGVVLLTVGRRINNKGQPSVDIGAYGSLSEVIDPGIVDPKKADAARVKAVLAMAPVPVDEAVIEALTKGDEELRKHGLPQEAQNILQVADHFRRKANEMALESEKAAALSKSLADAKSAELAAVPPSLSGIGVPEAQKAHADAAAHLTRTRLLAGQRMEAEERNKRISESIGERPDSTVDTGQPQRSVEDIEKRLAVVQAEMRQLESQHAAAMERYKSSLAANDAAAVALRKWDAARAELDRPITGPTVDDVHAAEERAERAATTLEESRKLAEVKRLQEEVGHELVAMEAHRERMAKYRELAHRVSTALGEVLAKHGVAGLDIEEGRLFATVNGKRELFGERLSFGQRVRIALDIALTAYKGRWIPVNPAFWSALQPSAQKEMAAIAKEHSVVLVTESPSDDDAITVEHL